MEKPCEICGDVGWVDAFRVCSKCKITHEHAYCMRVIYDGDPEKWVCEECETPYQKALSKPVPTQQTDIAGTRFKIKRPPDNTKTKYLPLEEVMGLESGAPKTSPSSTRKPSFSSRPPMNEVSPPRREPIRSTLPPKFIVKQDPLIGPPGFTKPLNLRSIPGSSRAQGLSVSKEKGKSVALVQNTLKESPARTGFAARNSGVSSSPAGKETSFGVHPKSQPRHVDSEGRVSTEATMKLDRCLPNHPTASPTWKGSFMIPKIPSEVVPRELIDGIQAHPPCKVHSKVYKLSKQLPKSLKFELLPKVDLWTNLFEDDVPGGLDIGLYFLPSNRNELTYACLVGYLSQYDLLLKAQIDGVELLIFSSKHLEENSQRMNKKYFLWGLFRPSEDSIVVSTSTSVSNAIILAQRFETGGEALITPLATAGPACLSEIGPLATANAASAPNDHLILLNGVERPLQEEPEDEDMDVDMVGGQDVGRPDLVVNRPKEAHADPPAGEIKAPEKKAEDALVVGFCPLEVKKEPNATIPSFEEWQREFDRKLQESFDRFAEMFQGKEAAGRVKLEVKDEGTEHRKPAY